MKKKFFALALILALSLSACGGSPSQDGGSSGTGTPEVNTPAGGETETPGETEAPGTPAEPEKDVDLTAFYNTLREENTWPELMDLTDSGAESELELLNAYYPGLSEISTKQCGVYIAAISAAVGEIALVEVENAADVQAVEDIFQARVDYQVGDDSNPGGAWYPETIEGWKNSARIVSHGNYVMLAVGDAADAAVESFDGLFA